MLPKRETSMPRSEPGPLLPMTLFAGVAALLMLRAVIAPPMTHDSFWIDHVWAEQFTAALRTGNLYPRWLPLSYGGLGAPVFYFYAPLSFYLAGLFGLAGLGTYASLLAAFGAAWFGSGVAMHAWLRGTRAPVAGALLYMVLPYHVMDFYARGALAESCAIALIPLVALGVRHAAATGRAPPLALAYAALVMTHLPTATFSSALLIAPWSLWLARREPRRLWPVARGVAGGIAGSALYLLPALTLQRHTSLGSLWSVKFLQPVSWSILHPELWTSTSYVLLFAGLACAVAMPAALLAWRGWGFWATWTIAVACIVAGLVPGFWSLPALSAVQFPWRALVLAEFGLATIVADRRGSPVAVAAALLPLLGCSFLMMTPDNPLHGEPAVPLPVHGRQDVIEYLPPGAVGEGRAPRLALIARAADIAAAEPGHVFPFPSLTARCPDGAPRPLGRDARDPLLATIPAGCTVEVTRLPAEKIGAGVSLLAWLAFALPWARRCFRARAAAPPKLLAAA